MHGSTAAILAEWAVTLNVEDIADRVIGKAEDCLIDAVACALVGRNAAGTARVHSVAASLYRNGKAGVWFEADRLNATGAAFVNATAASVLDLDDGHRGPLGHPGAAVIPAAVAVAEETASGGADLLAAIVAGYEVCTRIGTAERRPAYHTGNWSGFGVAAAAARLRGLSIEQATHALAITAYHGPRIADLTLSRDMGSNVKESIPWSVVAGLAATDLAAEGFSGCRDALDIEERFEPQRAVAGLGDEFQIMRTYFKRYSSCRWTHSAVEALLEIMREHGLTVEEIGAVHVETFHQAASLDNLADPPTPESAQYSVPYCLGVAATLGEHALMPLSADSLHHPPAVALAEKVTVVSTDKMNVLFPSAAPARLIVRTEKGDFDATVLLPWGEPDLSPNRHDIVRKFERLAHDRLPDRRAAEIVAAIEALHGDGIEPLVASLGSPEPRFSDPQVDTAPNCNPLAATQ